MIEIKDRVPAKPGQFKMIKEDGSYEYVTLERADEPVEEGSAINKALLENIQTEMLEDSKQLVAEYTSTEDLAQIDMTELDMVSDGGVYDVVMSGYKSGSSNYNIAIRINGIDTEDYHYKSYSSSSTTDSSYIDSGSGGREAGMSLITFGVFAGKIFAIIHGVEPNGTDVTGTWYIGWINTDNITSITFYNRASGNLLAGFNVKIYKRR